MTATVTSQDASASASSHHHADPTPATHSDPTEKLKSILIHLLPLLNLLASLLNTLGPYLHVISTHIHHVYTLAQQHSVDEALYMTYGLLLVFFGGTYMVTLAAIEAFRVFGFDKLQKALALLWENGREALEASLLDDTLDEDRDGIADVQQISKKDLVTRKIKVILITVDPQEVADALAALSAGCFAVLATLKIKYAQAIALGVALGDTLDSMVGIVINPVLLKMTPEQYKKWVPVASTYTLRTLGVMMAFVVQRVISGFYSSMRGSQMFLIALVSLSARKGFAIRDVLAPGTMMYTAAFLVLGMLGFWWQLSHLFRVPFPLSILMFPLTILEYFLMIVMAVMH